jgi:hypothetical protein
VYDKERKTEIMTTRTVRLDDDAERALARLRKLTRLSISEVLKRGLAAYEHLASTQGHVKPYDIYARLDLGAGGWSLGAARDAKSVLKKALRRKHGR